MLAIDLDDHVDFKVYMPRLGEWFWGELHDLARVAPSNPFRPSVLMGFPLWGDEFIKRFIHICLPTLMSPKNREALQFRSLFVIFTDEASFAGVWALAKDMTNAGLKTVVYRVGPDIATGLADEKYPLNKYWFLGACQQLSIQMAGRLGMAYHALHPDHLHSEGYFANMWRLAEEHPGASLAQTTISANIHDCIEELAKFRQEDSSLVIPDLELGDMGWRHIHKQTAMNLMNQDDITENLPHSHFLCWRGKDKLYVFCCHMNLVYLPPHAAARAPILLYNAIDTMLPHYVTRDVYVPDEKDGMTVIELSDEKKGASEHRVPFTVWAVQCWDTVHGSDNWMPFFECVCEIPIKEHPGWQEEELIRKQHSTLVEALKKVKEPAMEALKAERDRREKAKAEAKDASIAAENTMNFEPTDAMSDGSAILAADAKRARKMQRNIEQQAGT